ncbi:MAG: ATP-binding cassette domain-containing protein [Planctomycetota bacterium]
MTEETGPTSTAAASEPDAERLRLDGLVVERGGLRLGPLTLEVAPGETVWCSGPNGSGKSTLLHAVAGLIQPTSGTVRLGPLAWGSGDSPENRDVTFLLQDLGLFPHLTIRKQCLLYGERAGDAGTAATESRLDQLAETLQVAEFLDRKPSALSGGEAQRCALARTLCRPARVVLLDEPLAAQHESGRSWVLEQLEKTRAEGSIVLVASHQPFQATNRLEL